MKALIDGLAWWGAFGLVVAVVGFSCKRAPPQRYDPAPTNRSDYDAGVLDVQGGQMPSGSVACDELPGVLRFAVDVRRSAGLSAERTRGQVHEKYKIVLAECGLQLPPIASVGSVRAWNTV